MALRKPVVAGQFYPGDESTCRNEINQFLESISITEELPKTLCAGIAPHAGWTFSGHLAAYVFQAIKNQNVDVDTFVLFGAAHSFFGKLPAVFEAGSWQTPMGKIEIDQQLASWMIDQELAQPDQRAHIAEHSIEVQLPFIQYLFEGAKIVPVLTPPSRQSIELGRELGKKLESEEKGIVCVGSTDLTHYGPRYGFEPVGAGAEGIKWAFEVNDRQFIDLAVKMETEEMLTTAAENSNACGPGAAAGAAELAKARGAKSGHLLKHTSSHEVMAWKMGISSAESVGYAAIVF